ncbi:MAG: DUF6036 family nucleotidyltransferase [Deltaproteobacteria bacterium]|nr:DUF6036 family nucleotidyltransferase [Deltaproteobacteria bacterium]
MKAITKNEIPLLFEKIDIELGKQKRKVRVTVLGGFAVILQGYRERATLDIDIAPDADANLFSQVCRSLNIPVDIVTVTSTVDLAHTATARVFSGAFLVVDAVKGEDLIRLKLERFRKQDPEDIYAMIDSMQLSYEKFEEMVKDMLIDYVGNPQNLILSAEEIVQRKYPEFVKK